jgi:hypothetical protein
MDIAKIPKCEVAPSSFASASKRNIAIQAYSKASLVNKSAKAYLKHATVDAISRWLNSDNVRIEFYFCRNKGEIRARIIADDKIEFARDLSLYDFFSLGPVRV